MNPREDSIWSSKIEDYVSFHSMEINSGSVDPVYRVLDRMSQMLSSRETALLSFLHVAYYDFGSALRAFGRLGGRVDFGQVAPLARLRCGTERRGMRNPPELERHLKALFDIDARFGGLDAWAMNHPGHGDLYGALQSIYGNGRWAAYKASELLSWSMRRHLGQDARAWEPDNMGHAYSSGPRHGLALVTVLDLPTGNSGTAVRRLDGLSTRLVHYLQGCGVYASQATAETTLCDFNSLAQGHYYPGHDIHQLYGQIWRAWDEVQQERLITGHRALQTAMEAFEHAFGAAGMQQIDKARRAHYKLTGRLTA